MAGVNDLCSNHWNPPFTPDELRKLACPGNREVGSSTPPSYRAQALSTRLAPETVADIVRRYEEGASARSLAETHGVAASALVKLLRENHVVVKKRKVTGKESRVIAKEYEAGATVREIEAMHQLSHGAVLRALHREGVAMRARAPRKTR